MVQGFAKTVQQLLIKSDMPTNHHTPRYLLKQNEIHIPQNHSHVDTQSSLVCYRPWPETAPVHGQVNGQESGRTAAQWESTQYKGTSSRYRHR